MFIIDTDHVNLLEWGSGAIGQRLHERIRGLPEGEVATTIISFEEQTRGWLAFQARARTIEQQVTAYRKLNRHLNIYCEIDVLEFDTEAAAEFERLRREDRRDRAHLQGNSAYQESERLQQST